MSGILQTNSPWHTEIDAFWSAQAAVFHMPDISTRAGTHIHITPAPARQWSTDQVRKIAYGIVHYEDLIQKMLPAHRRTDVSTHDPTRVGPPISLTGHRLEHHYCIANSRSSSNLNRYFHHSGDSAQSRMIKLRCLDNSLQCMDKKQIVRHMQGDRYVLWNFQNINNSKGTIEFRGGRGVRGVNRTRWWIAFVVGFIHYLLTEV